MRKYFSLSSVFQSLVALALIFGCLFAAQCQLERGQSQADNNSIIKANLMKQPLDSNSLQELDAVANQWRKIIISGKFRNEHQELVRNRYHEGQFGFEVLTLFQALDGENFWIDRGWVAAGPNASTPPKVPALIAEQVTIEARIRSENLSRQLQGSFFVTKTQSVKPESIAKIQGVDAAPYYLDLLDSTNHVVKPLTEIELPELSNGPHFAYALQWLAFAVLVLIGRILLFRETKRLPLV